MWLSMTQPFNLVLMAKHYMRPHKRCNYDLTKYKTNLKRIYSVMEPRQQKQECSIPLMNFDLTSFIGSGTDLTQ